MTSQHRVPSDSDYEPDYELVKLHIQLGQLSSDLFHLNDDRWRDVDRFLFTVIDALLDEGCR